MGSIEDLDRDGNPARDCPASLIWLFACDLCEAASGKRLPEEFGGNAGPGSTVAAYPAVAP